MTTFTSKQYINDCSAAYLLTYYSKHTNGNLAIQSPCTHVFLLLFIDYQIENPTIQALIINVHSGKGKSVSRQYNIRD